jgi:hypothetical protein
MIFDYDPLAIVMLRIFNLGYMRSMATRPWKSPGADVIASAALNTDLSLSLVSDKDANASVISVNTLWILA